MMDNSEESDVDLTQDEMTDNGEESGDEDDEER